MLCTSIFSIFGECTGNVRSTPTPKDCLRTVNVSRAGALALDADALEDLDATARALDHLKVDAHGVTGLESRHLAHLARLEFLDHVHVLGLPIGRRLRCMLDDHRRHERHPPRLSARRAEARSRRQASMLA